MKILEINKIHYLKGGAERHYLDVSRLLENAGHTVIPFAMHHPLNIRTPYEKYFVSNVDAKTGVLKNLKNIPRFIYSGEVKKKLTELIKKEQPDIAHVHLIYHHLSASVLTTLKEFGIPIVYTIHDWKLFCPNFKFYTQGSVCERCKGGKYFNAVKNNCMGSVPGSILVAAEAELGDKYGWYKNTIDAYIAPSEFVKKKFIDFEWPKEKIHHLTHFLPQPGVVPTTSARRIDSLLPKDPFAVCVARLSHEKGVDFLVRTWVEEQIAHKLIIIGTGPMKEEIDRYIKNKQAGGRITMMDFTNDQEARYITSKAVVSIMPSRFYETFGIAAAEALRVGTPVIASGHGGQAELVKKSGGGWIFPTENSKSLGVAVREAFSNTIERGSRGESAKAYAQEHFAPEKYLLKIENLFNETIKKKAIGKLKNDL